MFGTVVVREKLFREVPSNSAAAVSSFDPRRAMAEPLLPFHVSQSEIRVGQRWREKTNKVGGGGGE